MGNKNFKANSFSVGGRQYFSTISFEGDVFETRQKTLTCKGVQCKRKKSMVLTDNTKAVEKLGSLSKK